MQQLGGGGAVNSFDMMTRNYRREDVPVGTPRLIIEGKFSTFQFISLFHKHGVFWKLKVLTSKDRDGQESLLIPS